MAARMRKIMRDDPHGWLDTMVAKAVVDVMGEGVTVGETIADLIEPEPEKTCRMVEVKTGEVADYRDTDEIIFHCKSCHVERGIFSYDEDGNVYSARPEYCPNCGAEVVDDA